MTVKCPKDRWHECPRSSCHACIVTTQRRCVPGDTPLAARTLTRVLPQRVEEDGIEGFMGMTPYFTKVTALESEVGMPLPPQGFTAFAA